MKVVVMFCTLLIGWALYGASATWTGIYTGDFPSEMTERTMESELRGRVSGSDGVGASIIGMFYIHEESATMRLKAYDYSETAAPVTTRWLLAVYGDIFGADTLSSFKDVELCSYLNCGVGGDVIEEPTNFYLAFVAVNSALGLDGQSMIVGGDSAIPEPSCVLLLLLGLGVFGLCRKRMGV